MVTRFLGSQTVRNTTREVGQFRSTVTGTILPVLGLSAAMSFMSGGFNDATASGRIATSANYQLTTSMYGLQDAITRALLPAIESITPVVSDAVDWFVELNKQTDGWATYIALAGGAAFLARGQISALVKGSISGIAAMRAAGVIGTLSAVGSAGAVAAGVAGAAGIGVVGHGIVTGDTGPSRRIDEITRLTALTDAATEFFGGTATGVGPLEHQVQQYQQGGDSALGRLGDTVRFIREQLDAQATPPEQAPASQSTFFTPQTIQFASQTPEGANITPSTPADSQVQGINLTPSPDSQNTQGSRQTTTDSQFSLSGSPTYTPQRIDPSPIASQLYPLRQTQPTEAPQPAQFDPSYFTPRQDATGRADAQATISSATDRPQTVIINAPGVYDQDGLIRQLRTLFDNGSLKVD